MKEALSSIIMKSISNYNIKMPFDEMEQAFNELTHNELKLLIYYYGKHTGWKFVDTEIMNTLNIQERTLKAVRKGLENKGYIRIQRGYPNDVYYIGKQQIANNYKEPETSEGATNADH